MGKATVIPFGPQHPVLPEPLHLDLVVEDETVLEAIPQIGFIHRGLEKLVETRDLNQFIYVAERICGICAFGHSMGYAETVEKLMGVEVPRRAEYLRVIWHELSRIHSHVLWMGLAADAFGFESLFMHCWRLRERVLDIFEKTTGGRVIFSVVKVGGVVRDIDDAQMAEIKRMLEGIKDDYRQICDAFLKDSSVKNRTVGVGYISHEDALAQSMVGPFARASNVNYDARMLGNGGYGETFRLPARAGLPGRLLRPRQGARAGGAAVHRHHRGDDGQDPRRRHRRAREGRPRGGRAGRQRGGAAPRRVLLLRARQRVEVPGAHAHAHAHLAEPRRHDHGAGGLRSGRRQHDRAHHRPLHQLHGKVGGTWVDSNWGR